MHSWKESTKTTAQQTSYNKPHLDYTRDFLIMATIGGGYTILQSKDKDESLTFQKSFTNFDDLLYFLNTQSRETTTGTTTIGIYGKKANYDSPTSRSTLDTREFDPDES